MSKQKYTPPEPELPKPRSPLQIILIGIGLFILLSIALQMCGIKIMNRSDEEKLIDRPHSSDREERDVPKDLQEKD